MTSQFPNTQHAVQIIGPDQVVVNPAKAVPEVGPTQLLLQVEACGMLVEDIDFVAPAVAALRAEGIDAVGPLPSDTMFSTRARQGYDAAICMYHDQALIPVKTIAFDETVNVTLGLPFVRTSPDHGTAFDIAGSGLARPESFVAALRLADRMTAEAAEFAAV